MITAITSIRSFVVAQFAVVVFKFFVNDGEYGEDMFLL